MKSIVSDAEFEELVKIIETKV
jgi:hypothetical protein